MSKKLCDEYFEYYTKYTKLYGDKTCILMQVGMFYEIQSIKNDNESIGNLDHVADILHIQITKKNKNIKTVDRNNPLFAGFPKHALSKYLNILLTNNYTVIVIDQNDISGKQTNRSVTGVYSPSIYPIELNIENSSDGNNLSSILIELYKHKKSEVSCILSFCNINLTMNTFDVYEKYITIYNQRYETILDEISKIAIRYNTNEYLILIKNNLPMSNNGVPKQLEKEFIINYLDIWSTLLHYYPDCDDTGDSNYENKILREYFNHIDFGLLDPIVFFELEKYQTSVTNILQALLFITKHDKSYIKNIAPPKMVIDNDRLILEMNTLQQLNVIPSKNNHITFGSLFNVINKTLTTIGKRGLKKLLCKPFTDSEQIQLRYDISEMFQQSSKVSKLEKILQEISDFDKLHRKMSLGALHPYEFYNLHNTYEHILELNEYLSIFKDTIPEVLLQNDTLKLLTDFMKEYTELFDMDQLRKYNLHESANSIGHFFNTTQSDVQLNEIYNKIKKLEDSIEQHRLFYDSKIGENTSFVKLMYTETEGYYFTCTNIRVKLLQQRLSDEEKKQLTIKTNTSTCKITTSTLTNYSRELTNTRELFSQKIKLYYIDAIKEFYSKYNTIFPKLSHFVEIIDICYSNARCKTLYNYCKPIIENSDESFVNAEELRHPIIERINTKTMYVPNDIHLSPEKNGMVLYALNSCGKSSLLRALGLSVIMAQCGLYVPCKNFVFSPFKCIVTQVDLYDNLWKSQSSFITEMLGLRKILNLANKNCLVLSDELTKGTEVVSATSIFAAAVLKLVEKGSKFIFTTHLQNVAKLDCIKKCEKIKISHLSVIIDNENNNITFERKLQDGPSSELYGLEVAKAVGLDKSTIDLSFEIRNQLMGINTTTKIKKSRYNVKKLLEKCEICEYTPYNHTDLPLDTHHIKFQCTADANQFNDHYHKNSEFNLVCLCKRCHIDVHKGLITITGYKQTTKGVQLNFVK